jgi:glycosyltransferase involved in cell wall biosynthesis
MRVLMISNLWPPVVSGGAERYLARLADTLAADGHEIGVVTFGVQGERVVASVDDHGFDSGRWWEASTMARRRFQLFDLWNPEARRVLARAVDAFRPDVVHSRAVAGFSVAALLTDAPRVHHVPDFWLLCQRGYPQRNGERCRSTCATCVPFARTRRYLLGRRPPRFIAPSEAIRREHVDAGYDPGRWEVIRHPVTDPEPVDLPPRARTPGDPLQLGFIGRLIPDKGFDLVLDTLEALPDARLVSAGHGQLADAAASHPAVEHRGVVEGVEKERFFRDIDVLLVPSRVDEIAGQVIDEAAVRGVPVIASRRGGIPEYVPPGCLDLLFDPDVPGALAAAIQRYHADPARFPSTPPIGHSWPEHAARILDAFGRAIAEHA